MSYSRADEGGHPAAPADGQVLERWELRLYIAGRTGHSLTAIANLKQICEDHLKDRYQIQVIDLLEDPSLCGEDQIIAIPTVVRRLPLPVRKIVGDLSDKDRALMGLQLKRA